ncbi:unnamed protein product [Ascophyllum nodosum]
MVHNTPAPVRARYFPLTGDQVTRGVPSDGSNYYIVTVGRREEWWWQSGPVAWCCLCFTLEVGESDAVGTRLLHRLESWSERVNRGRTRDNYSNCCERPVVPCFSVVALFF